jgi:hypothetical protein
MKVKRYIHEWISDKSNVVFYTYPMIHIGEPEFYHTISKEIGTLNLLLTEGVALGKSELGTYNKLAIRLQLASQSSMLHFASDLPIKNIDIDPAEFHKGIQRLSYRDKLKLFWITFLLSFPRLLGGEKVIDNLQNMLCYPKDKEYHFKNPLNHFAFKNKNKSSLDLLIQNTRNDIIRKNLVKVIQENKDRKFRYDIGIIFGDNHMPHIYETLKENNFKWELYKEVIVL